MSILPNTVCRRCHRKYPSIRGRCPYCGTKRDKEVRSSVPESDSAVRGSEAQRRAAESVNWQMLVGGVLLLCVVIAMIAVISVNMKSRVEETETLSSENLQGPADVSLDTTPVPVPTPSPTPSPTPTPSITSIEITTESGSPIDDFTELNGTKIQLRASTYPANVPAEITWTSSDENVATVDETGLVTMVGSYGQYSIITASAGIASATCYARVGNW